MLANALTPQRKRTHRRRSARRSSVFGNALGNAAIQGIQNWQANRAASQRSLSANQGSFLDRYPDATASGYGGQKGILDNIPGTMSTDGNGMYGAGENSNTDLTDPRFASDPADFTLDQMAIDTKWRIFAVHARDYVDSYGTNFITDRASVDAAITAYDEANNVNAQFDVAKVEYATQLLNDMLAKNDWTWSPAPAASNSEPTNMPRVEVVGVRIGDQTASNQNSQQVQALVAQGAPEPTADDLSTNAALADYVNTYSNIGHTNANAVTLPTVTANTPAVSTKNYESEIAFVGDVFGGAATWLDRLGNATSAYVKYPALQKLSRAGALWAGQMKEIATASTLNKAATVFGPNAKSTGLLLDANATWGRGLRWIGTAAKVGTVIDEGAYLANAPKGQFPKAAVASAVNTAGTWGSIEAGAELGAGFGAIAGGGVLDEFTIPLFAAGFGIAAGFGWNALAQKPIRDWGYTPSAPEPYIPPTAEEMNKMIRESHMVRHYP